MRPYIGGSILIVALCSTTGCGISGQPEKKGLIAKFEKDALGRYHRGYLGPGSTTRFNVELSIKITETKKSGTLYGTLETVISEGPASPNGNRTIKASGTTTFDRNAMEKLKTPVVFKSVRVMELMPSGELRTISLETSSNGKLASKKYILNQDLPAWIEENKSYSGNDIAEPNNKVHWKAKFEEPRRISTRAGNFDCLLGSSIRVGKSESTETTGYYCPTIDEYITYSERIKTARSELESKCDLDSATIKPLH